MYMYMCMSIPSQLWALLHFIMPTMFDSHEEFNEWFSRDIESHAEKKGGLDENQLSRLHMILKPFMLRRIKRDVEHEMAEKVYRTIHTYACMYMHVHVHVHSYLNFCTFIVHMVYA